MSKKFSIIFSSRGRPQMLAILLDSIKYTTKNIDDIEVLISCDLDDESMMDFDFSKWNICFLPKQKTPSISMNSVFILLLFL